MAMDSEFLEERTSNHLSFVVDNNHIGRWNSTCHQIQPLRSGHRSLLST